MSQNGGYSTPETGQCARCGEAISPSASFCSNCGNPVTREALLPTPLSDPDLAELEYMGFWIRLLAWLVDLAVVLFVYSLLARSGLHLLAMVLGPAYAALFIGLRGQTPGKMVLGIRVVNSRGQVPGIPVAIFREIVGKFISGIALFLGYAWIGWDREKRGWHDHFADTYVVRKTR